MILGLTRREDEPKTKRLFTYTAQKGDPIESNHLKLSPYLIDATNLTNPYLVVRDEQHSINGLPKVVMGTKPTDGGHLIFLPEERDAFLKLEPEAAPFMCPFVGAEELINGKLRYILVLKDASPSELRHLPHVLDRLEKVRQMRQASIKAATRALADTPTRFDCGAIPDKPFLAIPEVSSERREYVPLAYLEPPTVPSNLLRVLPDVSLWLFGLLTSRMHMAWLRTIGGRLKSDYRYTIDVVYNTFPLPKLADADKARLGALAQKVLDARAAFPDSSLADLYDRITMPPVLRKAHQALDTAVEKAYRAQPFVDDRERAEHLLMLYEAMASPLMVAAQQKPKRARTRKQA